MYNVMKKKFFSLLFGGRATFGGWGFANFGGSLFSGFIRSQGGSLLSDLYGRLH